MGRKAGKATLNQTDVDNSNNLSPIWNATPDDLANEVIHLFRPNGRITGQIRHVDGGYNIMG